MMLSVLSPAVHRAEDRGDAGDRHLGRTCLIFLAAVLFHQDVSHGGVGTCRADSGGGCTQPISGATC